MYRENDTIGPYTLRRKLGKGAFGVVWLAEKRTAFGNFEYALKMAARDDIDLNAVAEEVTTWKDAKGHPNVLPLIDADVYGEDFVIVSEYAPDGSLQTWLNARGGRAPDTETAVAMTEGILDGLIHLHAKRIIHRDLKPDNILLRGAAPMLADFGLARVLKTTHSSNIAGTVQYMSPEALDNKRVEQVDVWSVGVILYQMLSGRLPFAGQGPPLMMSILRDEPAPLPSSVPAGLRQIVARALQKDLTKRQATAQALRDELRAFTEQQAEARRQAAQQPTETDLARLRAEEERRQQAVAERQRQQQAEARRQAEQERQAREAAAAEQKRRADEEERRKQRQAQGFVAAPARPLWPKVAGVGAAVLLSVSLLGYALSGGGAARPPADGGGSAVDAPPTALKSKDYTETLPNGVKLEMAAIPAGKFTMGSTDAQIAEAIKTCKQQCSGCNCDYYNNEKPQREVSVPAMYMGKYEVTQEQWQAVMNNNPSRFQNCPKCPVENVSWEDVKEFIKKLNSLQNKYVYRLPSEAEWEYNARAGTKTAFAFGDSLSSSQANFDGNYPYGGAAKGEYRRKTIPVGSFQPNAFGLYDMHGNVWEWCEDIYQDNYNSLPTDGSPNMSRGDSSFRLLRGGSWFNDGYVLRSARRVRVGPSVRLVNYGARLAASAK